MLDLLIAGDFQSLRKFWKQVCPSMPCPSSNEEAEIAMHIARTACEAVPEKLRLWSARWLMERGHAHLLPPELQPKLDVIQVETVGLSINAAPMFQPVADEVRKGVEAKILDVMSSNKPVSSTFVRAAIRDEAAQQVKKLLGRKI